jgi:putative FmdB family regulatory protein
MPIHEFRCSQCGAEFEKIVFSTDKEPVKCPQCGADKAERLMSVCSLSSASTDIGAASTSSCATSPGGFT